MDGSTANSKETYVASVTNLPIADVITNATVNFHNGCILTSSPDGAGDVFSPETELLISKIKSAVIMPVLFMFGAPTNVLNMIVFYKQGLGDRINLCLFSLAIVDFAVVTFYFLLYVENIFMFYSPETETQVDEFLTNNKILLFYSCTFGAKVLTVIIALERCFCVLFPFHAKTLLKTRTMAAIIIVIVPIVCFLRLAVLAKYIIVCVFDERRQLELRGHYVTDYAVRNKQMLEILDGIFYGFIMALGCPLVVLVATLITIGKLWQTAAWRKQSSSADTRKEAAVTKMLVALSVMFVICNLPNVWIRTYPLFNPKFSTNNEYRYLFMACVSFAEIGLYMESSFSFIIYYLGSSRYRESCNSLVKTRFCLEHAYRTSNVSKISSVWGFSESRESRAVSCGHMAWTCTLVATIHWLGHVPHASRLHLQNGPAMYTREVDEQRETQRDMEVNLREGPEEQRQPSDQQQTESDGRPLSSHVPAEED